MEKRTPTLSDIKQNIKTEQNKSQRIDNTEYISQFNAMFNDYQHLFGIPKTPFLQ